MYKSETLGFVGLYWVKLSICIIPLNNIQSAASVDVPGFGEPRKSTYLCFICVCFRSSMHNRKYGTSKTLMAHLDFMKINLKKNLHFGHRDIPEHGRRSLLYIMEIIVR